MVPDGPPPANPEAALQHLVEGNRRFAAGELLAPGRELARLKSLAEEQKPFAALLSCADSRVPVEIVFDQGFGDLFVVRVAGNLATAVETASLEYGALVLGAKVVLVLGHTNCGAVKAAMQGVAVPGQVSTLFQHMIPAVERGDKDIEASIRANVQLQARKLRSSPVLGDLVGGGKLVIAGGVYDLASSRVTLVDV